MQRYISRELAITSLSVEIMKLDFANGDKEQLEFKWDNKRRNEQRGFIPDNAGLIIGFTGSITSNVISVILPMLMSGYTVALEKGYHSVQVEDNSQATLSLLDKFMEMGSLFSMRS